MVLDQNKLSWIDLRKTLKELRDHFRWLGLRLQDMSKKCSCLLDLNKVNKLSGKVLCTRCFNTGYLFTDYIAKGYLWLSVQGVEFSTEVGPISTQRTNLVLEFDRPIKKFDRVLLIDLDSETGQPRQPFSIMREYIISDYFQLMGEENSVKFWKCFLEERNLIDGRPGEGIGTTNELR